MPKQEEPATQTVKASELPGQWGQVLDQVSSGRKRVVVEQSGGPVAAIVSARDLERLQAFEAQRARDFQVLDEIREAFKDVDEATIEQETAKAVAAARARRREEVERATRHP